MKAAKQHLAEHRVINVSQELKKAISETRSATGLTNEKLIESAVNDHLAAIVESLQLIGVGEDKGPTKKARWPMSEQTIADLKEASILTGLPAVQLLRICLRRRCYVDLSAASSSAARKGTRSTSARKPRGTAKAKGMASGRSRKARKAVTQ